jgi:hypothetical protein
MQDFHHYDFTIAMPDRWIDATVVVIAGPPAGSYSPNITINREQLTFHLSAAEYAATQLAQLQQALEQQKYKVSDEALLSLGELSAFQRTHTFEVAEDNTRVMQLQVYVVKDKEALTITCTNLAERFEETRPTFQEVIRSFRWR